MTGSQRHFEWLLDIIREVEEVDEKGIVSIDIFITQFFQNFDLRTCMLVGSALTYIFVKLKKTWIFFYLQLEKQDVEVLRKLSQVFFMTQ